MISYFYTTDAILQPPLLPVEYTSYISHLYNPMRMQHLQYSTCDVPFWIFNIYQSLRYDMQIFNMVVSLEKLLKLTHHMSAVC